MNIFGLQTGGPLILYVYDFCVQGLRKSSVCGRVKKTIVPRSVPNMVHLEKYIFSEDSTFLLLQYAEGELFSLFLLFA